MYADDYKDENGQYSTRNYLKRGMQLISFKLFTDLLKRCIPECGSIRAGFLYLDFLWCLVRYRAIVYDYFYYHFWEKKACLRKTYVTKGYSRYIQRQFNAVGGVKFLYSKVEFNKAFAHFRTVDMFEFPGSYEMFETFVEKANRKIIMKPIYGSSGRGIFIPDVSDKAKTWSLYNEYSSQDVYFAEGLFIQTGPLSEINPSSVNTVRIYTVYDGKDVNIMNALVRFGAPGSTTDNVGGGGMCCELDLDEGIIISPGYDSIGTRYVKNSATGKYVAGVRVPHWKAVIEFVKKAALVHPEVGYVGWDIAVSNEKIHLIEANEQGNFNMPQRVLGRGIKAEYLRVIDKKRQNTKGA